VKCVKEFEYDEEWLRLHERWSDSQVGRVQRFLPGTRRAIETRERLSFRGYSNVFVGKEPQVLSQKLATRHPQGHKESGDNTKVFKHGSRTSKLRQAVEEAYRFQARPTANTARSSLSTYYIWWRFWDKCSSTMIAPPHGSFLQAASAQACKRLRSCLECGPEVLRCAHSVVVLEWQSGRLAYSGLVTSSITDARSAEGFPSDQE
jgi:hypothetical protein